MTFSIITPSFRQPEWFRLCMASVADQAGVDVEHIVQDNCSGPEVEAVARAFPKARLVVEKDAGMYDAVNRGLRRATGDVCSYLNCDEQYLPGALQGVEQYFHQHPEADVVFGDVVVTRADGSYFCTRQVVRPLEFHTRICQFNTFTAATFFRRSILEDYSAWFDPQWKATGDARWVLALLERGVRMGVLREFTSTFADTGANLGMDAAAQAEAAELRGSAPRWAVRLDWFWVLHHRLRRLLSGHYLPKPLSYSIYTKAQPGTRTMFEVVRPRVLWTGRFGWRR